MNKDSYAEVIFKVIMPTIITIILVLYAAILSEKLNNNRYDINRDGVIDAVDYVKVYKYIMEN